jgi:hypothetical protein
MDNQDPGSYAFQEGRGEPSTSVPIRLANFRIYGGAGVPAATLGANGDFYLRSDGAAGANTTVYHKEAGTWTGLTA